ncbi:inorganic diphosphatase, partial [Geodermatophilus chilensis]|uniref:inorganic diphosphatase n=1 Tax=Geodermatophilus chilensis TaxID=2035835 RepID=UPI0018E433FA
MSEPDQLDVVVESPRGSRNKYEFDEERGVMRLDRRILAPVPQLSAGSGDGARRLSWSQARQFGGASDRLV